MLDLHHSDGVADTKVYFSHSVLPPYIDPQNVSTKKKPFSTFNQLKFSHSLDLILPGVLFTLVKDNIEKLDGTTPTKYARVHMKLSEILESEFLNSYIKQGNIMMLSEGRPLVDNRFHIYEGTLRMELNKPTYERCGLQGMPIEDGGKKHQKQRWVVEYDLRANSMKHGGKAFSRLERVCRDVLNHSLTWLFYNFNPSSTEALTEGKEPISKHAPWIHDTIPKARVLQEQLIPKVSMSTISEVYDKDESLNLLEYLHMLSLESPRLHVDDAIDPHLSRYEVPDLGSGIGSGNIVHIRWTGFLSPVFVRQIFLNVRTSVFKSKAKIQGESDMGVGKENSMEEQAAEDQWFAMSAHGFGGQSSWTLMQFARRETLVWEAES
ncbi:hypothetical protein ACN47E_010060 [Coniothyrium glycines]